MLCVGVCDVCVCVCVCVCMCVRDIMCVCVHMHTALKQGFLTGFLRYTSVLHVERV